MEMKKRWVVFVVCGIMVQVTVGGTSGDGEYDDLMATFCRGKLTEVIDNIQEKKESGSGTSNRFLRLLARATGERYLRYYHLGQLDGKSMSSVERTKLNQLARSCTESYELAVLGSSRNYDKACLAAQWWTLYMHPRFNADSKIIRRHTIAGLQKRQRLQRKINCQAAQFKSAFCALLHEAKSTQKWSLHNKEALCDMADKIFREFAIIDIPSDVFEVLLSDLPFFVCTFMPAIDPSKKAEIAQNTLSWYIWNALTVTLPDTIERQFIEKQVHEWAEGIEHNIHSLTVHPHFETAGSEYAKRFLKCYEQAKNNRFVPYFKRVLLDYQMQRSERTWASTYKDILSGWKRNLTEIESLPTKQEKDKEYIQQHKAHAWLIYAFRFDRFAQHCFPTRLTDLPGKTNSMAEGELNENLFWVFVVTKVEPRP
jgi:hypothetical protein